MDTSAIGSPFQPTSSNQATSSSLPTSSNQKNDALRGLDIDQFIKLMVAELQNQDPLDPMNNTEILQQISQMRNIDVSDRLGSTLDAVLAGQNFASASSMVGKYVRALSDSNGYIEGQVDSVSVADGKINLHIGDNSVALDKVAEIFNQQPDQATNAATDGTT